MEKAVAKTYPDAVKTAARNFYLYNEDSTAETLHHHLQKSYPNECQNLPLSTVTAWITRGNWAKAKETQIKGNKLFTEIYPDVAEKAEILKDVDSDYAKMQEFLEDALFSFAADPNKGFKNPKDIITVLNSLYANRSEIWDKRINQDKINQIIFIFNEALAKYVPEKRLEVLAFAMSKAIDLFPKH